MQPVGSGLGQASHTSKTRTLRIMALSSRMQESVGIHAHDLTCIARKSPDATQGSLQQSMVGMTVRLVAVVAKFIDVSDTRFEIGALQGKP